MENRPAKLRTFFLFLIAPIALIALIAQETNAQVPVKTKNESPAYYGRNYDSRLESPSVRKIIPHDAQLVGIEELQRGVGDLLVGFNELGATETISSATQYLTKPDDRDPQIVAQEYLMGRLEALGLSADDIREVVLTDRVPSISGTTHLYYAQQFKGIRCYQCQLQMHVDRLGRLKMINNGFMPGLARSIRSTRPEISALRALEAAAAFVGLSGAERSSITETNADAAQTMVFENRQLSDEPMTVKLVWVPLRAGVVALAWNFQFRTQESWPELTVDATTGAVITLFDQLTSADYRVYPRPVQSPQHTTPLPPADARTLVVDPEDATASPNGWFNAATTIMQGNNVHACADRDGNNACDSGQPSCGAGLVCDFTINLAAAPLTSLNAAIANLFYWNNTVHDIQYQYGFDEPGGNFQENNFGRGGAGSDSVNAEAQDNAAGASRCNANFGTPTDGGNPRMQMFICNNTTPDRDGDFDDGVIVHEYGHGISTRQIGGPTVNCLGNRQQAGEGWSDFHALVYTAVASDLGTDIRGVGSYLFGLAPNGTIRPQPYTTDPAANTYTYESINGLAVPHGLGSVWAEVAWKMYWAMVDKHGFEGDLINFDLNDPTEAGNKRALFYINEGFKNTACSPTFVANRDGVIQAAIDSFNGEDVCDLWEVFAAYGLGTDAVSGGSASTTPTNGFSLPASCNAPQPVGSCLFDATFDSGADNFAFVDDAEDPAYTSGTAAGGQINVNVGGVDDADILNMLGAWDRPCSLAGATNVTITVEANLTQSANYESNETSSVQLTVDGAINVLATVSGDGNGGAAVTTGVQTYTISTNLSAGNHTIRVGCFNSAKTLADESTTCAFQRVTVSSGQAPVCVVDDDFEGASTSWTTSPLNTCATGMFVLGTPTQVIDGGVVTQVAGAASGARALFTAPNSSAGVDDVDGGNCVVQSPVFAVSDASMLSISYFHGQRDAADDAAGDFFRLELSTDGGATFSNLASRGDQTSNAAWTQVTAPIPAGSQVQLRAQCSDAAPSGDLVECGIDDLTICR